MKEKSRKKLWVKRRHRVVFAVLRVILTPILWLKYRYGADRAPIKSGPSSPNL